jgi:GNAT superfamily N-acetyltransferase
MNLQVRHSCSEFDSYRAARVKSLFNCESGANFSLDANLPIEGDDWGLGVIVGPSGSGKTSLGRQVFGPEAFYEPKGWPDDAPLIDAIAPSGAFNDVTSALAAVGLGSVPSWLRPYPVLSNGEKFRADLARIICEQPARVVVDEFTSVVDRQVARVGSAAFAKAWRRTKGQAILLSCHYDILDWLQPDWVYDTNTGTFSGRWLRRRPTIQLDIHQTNWRHWPLFEKHHYLKLPHMIAATNYVATIEGQLVAHVAFSTRPGMREARAARMVVMPEWQGAGVGLSFLNALCAMWWRGENRFGLPLGTLFHTSHPGLSRALRRAPNWSQITSSLYGDNRARNMEAVNKSHEKACTEGRPWKSGATGKAGHGGHFRAVGGFRYSEGAP